MQQQINNLCDELNVELNQILSYWVNNTVDNEFGGFVGSIGYPDLIIANAPKGSVLNARILWTFAAAYRVTGIPVYAEMAHRAYNYFTQNFIDRLNGGVFWELNYLGEPLNPRKQIYAIAFGIYGLAEYYRTFKIQAALDQAIELYKAIEKYSFDKIHNGYIEALTRDWKRLDDYALSPKDLNCSKTMNTHLHILEAYATLYRVWKSDELKKSLQNLIELFIDKFIDRKTSNLILFFDDYWNPQSAEVSFGHDIECSWLLYEAAEVLGNNHLLVKAGITAYNMAKATYRGFDTDNGLFNEMFPDKEHIDTDKHWWPQAESIVGYFNAYQISGDTSFAKTAIKSWEFTKNFIKDKQYGEWFWKVNKNREPYLTEQKVGFWKCPYHNSRACIEIIERTKHIQLL